MIAGIPRASGSLGGDGEVDAGRHVLHFLPAVPAFFCFFFCRPAHGVLGPRTDTDHLSPHTLHEHPRETEGSSARAEPAFSPASCPRTDYRNQQQVAQKRRTFPVLPVLARDLLVSKAKYQTTDPRLTHTQGSRKLQLKTPKETCKPIGSMKRPQHQPRAQPMYTLRTQSKRR